PSCAATKCKQHRDLGEHPPRPGYCLSPRVRLAPRSGMEASRSTREKTADTTLSRKLADFLVELSIALHKRSIYPDGHPYLRSSADRFADRVSTLLESRDAIVIGVARDRLVIESATTDPA